MSIRTTIEINHDSLVNILTFRSSNNKDWQALLAMMLAAGRTDQLNTLPGVKFLHQRHHSEDHPMQPTKAKHSHDQHSIEDSDG